MAKTIKTTADIDFEKKLNRLEEITSLIENNTLSLNDSVKLYEEGKKIIKELETALKDAESKINKIVKEIE